jgi:hypothetical protein
MKKLSEVTKGDFLWQSNCRKLFALGFKLGEADLSAVYEIDFLTLAKRLFPSR